MDRLAAVRAIVARLASKWRSAPPIDVVATAADLPVPAPADARGVFWRRRVYVVASQPLMDVAATVNHEVVAHHGLRELLGSKWARFMEGLHSGTQVARDRPLRKLRDHVKKAYANRRGRCTLHACALADEVAAAAVEQGTHAWMGEFKPRRTKLRERFSSVLQKLRQRKPGRLRLGYQHLVAALKAAARRLKTVAKLRAERRRAGPKWWKLKRRLNPHAI